MKSRRLRTGLRAGLSLVLATGMLGLSACGKAESESITDRLKYDTIKKYDLTVKLNSNGSDRYIKFDGFDFRNSGDEPNHTHTEVYTKNSVDAEYEYLTTLDSYKDDKYINMRALTNRFANIEELSGYVDLFNEVEKDVVIYNNDYIKSAFETYLDNNPNLSNAAKPRIITEKETAFGVTDGASLRTQSKLTNNTEDLSRLSDMTSFVNNDTRSDVVNSFSTLYDMAINKGASESYMLGTQETKLEAQDAISYISDLQSLASDEMLVQTVFNGFFDTDFGAYMLEKSNSKLNNGLNDYFTDILAEATDDAIVEFRVAEGGALNKEIGVYVKISSNGTNGIEVLFNGGKKISDEEITSYFKVPSNTMTSTDFFKSVAIKYLDK